MAPDQRHFPDAPPTGSGLIFLGTGSSTGVPTPRCVLQPSNPPCKVCSTSLVLQPHENPDYRCNPSVVVRYAHPDGRLRHVQIDCGKHFRESMLRWFPKHKIPSLDALLLTHEHADATLGIDDLRGLQGYGTQQEPITVFLDQYAQDSVALRFPYLQPNAQEGAAVVRRVAAINWKVVTAGVPFCVEGLEILPVAMKHGEDYEALGFVFGEEQRVAYLSDVSRIEDESMAVLQSAPIHLLVIDALLVEKHHPTHFNMRQALDVIKLLRPARAYLTGLSHQFDHAETGAELAALRETEGIDVMLPRDGLWVPLEL